MKKVLLILAVLLALPVAAMAQKQAVGGSLDANTKNRGLGVTMFYQYSVSPNVRIAPDMGFNIRRRDLDDVHFNLNAHVPLGITGSSVGLYPLVGLNLTRWNLHKKYSNEYVDLNYTNHYLRLGLNLGAGFQLKVASNLMMKAEVKYVMTKNYSNFVSSLGVGYIF